MLLGVCVKCIFCPQGVKPWKKNWGEKKGGGGAMRVLFELENTITYITSGILMHVCGV